MCTVSWLHAPDGYRLFANRDELRSRRAASPPEILLRGGVRFAAPRDGDAGGTWIAVNEFGVSLCLLNRTGPAGERSRGLLLTELIAARSLREAAGRAFDADLAPFAPFTLALLEPGRETAVIRWDGRAKEMAANAEAEMPLCSSSFDAAGARLRRRESLARLRDLPLFHRSHDPEPGPYSVCMHRADAETVSLTTVRVARGEIEMSYLAGPPCRASRETVCRIC